MSSAETNPTPPPLAGSTATDTTAGAVEETAGNRSQGTTNARARRQGSGGNSTLFCISNFKGEVSDVGAVIGTKSENRTKDLMMLFQEKLASYVMREYKKGRDIIPLIKKIEEVNTSKWKPTTPAVAEGKTVPAAEMMEYKLISNDYLA